MNDEMTTNDWVSTGVPASEPMQTGNFPRTNRSGYEVVSMQATVGGLSLDKIKAAMAVLESNEITPSAMEIARLMCFYKEVQPKHVELFKEAISITSKEEAEFQRNMLEVARSMAAKCRAAAEYRTGVAERAARDAAKAERIANASKNMPRLKASDLFKAGVLFVPENGEQPDPEKFGADLVVHFKENCGNGGIWAQVEFDTGLECWCLKDELAHRIDFEEIECWMLPPALKE